MAGNELRIIEVNDNEEQLNDSQWMTFVIWAAQLLWPFIVFFLAFGQGCANIFAGNSCFKFIKQFFPSLPDQLILPFTVAAFLAQFSLSKSSLDSLAEFDDTQVMRHPTIPRDCMVPGVQAGLAIAGSVTAMAFTASAFQDFFTRHSAGNIAKVISMPPTLLSFFSGMPLYYDGIGSSGDRILRLLHGVRRSSYILVLAPISAVFLLVSSVFSLISVTGRIDSTNELMNRWYVPFDFSATALCNIPSFFLYLMGYLKVCYLLIDRVKFLNNQMPYAPLCKKLSIIVLSITSTIMIEGCLPFLISSVSGVGNGATCYYALKSWFEGNQYQLYIEWAGFVIGTITSQTLNTISTAQLIRKFGMGKHYDKVHESILKRLADIFGVTLYPDDDVFRTPIGSNAASVWEP